MAAWLKDAKSPAQAVSTTGLQVRFRFDEQKGVTLRELGAGKQTARLRRLKVR